jgi:hypothetical protein
VKNGQGAARVQVLPLPVLETQEWAFCAKAEATLSHEVSANANTANDVAVFVMTALSMDE